MHYTILCTINDEILSESYAANSKVSSLDAFATSVDYRLVFGKGLVDTERGSVAHTIILSFYAMDNKLPGVEQHTSNYAIDA
jgi:hypothetical protein